MLEVLHHKDGLDTLTVSVLQCGTKLTCDLQWLTVRSMQSLGGRLELAQMQGCPQFFGDHRHLCSCVHLERHFVTINADGTVPHGGLVCTDGVEIGSVVVVCCIRLPGYVSNRLVEALCAIVPLLVAGVAFSVTGWALLM